MSSETPTDAMMEQFQRNQQSEISWTAAPDVTDDAIGADLDLFDALVGLWLPGILSVFGIVGNALSLWVLSRDRIRSATLTSLKALAVSDLILLLGALCQQIVPLSCDYFGSLTRRSWLCVRRGYIQVYAWPVVCAAQMASVWLTVLISTERFLAVCSPLGSYNSGLQSTSFGSRRRTTTAAAFSTVRLALIGPRRVRFAVTVIVIASICFNLPRLFEFQPTTVADNDKTNAVDGKSDVDVSTNSLSENVTINAAYSVSGVTVHPAEYSIDSFNCGFIDRVSTCIYSASTPDKLDDDYQYQVVLGDTALRSDDIYLYVYNTAFYCLIVYAVPLLIVDVFNVRLVVTLARCRRVWNALNSNVKRELRATRLPLVIVLVFSVCGTVSLLGFVLDAVYATSGGSSSPRWLQIYTAIGNLLVILNSAVNFLLMLCFGNKFRRMLSDAVRCRPTNTTARRTVWKSCDRSAMSLSVRESLL